MKEALVVATSVLLAGGVLLTIACAVGVMVMRDPYQRLHFTSPAATLSASLVALAVVLGGGDAQAILKALLVVVLLAFQNGVVCHATARATFVRERECWPPPERDLEPAQGDGS